MKLTKSVLFAPRAFFAQLHEPYGYRDSFVYLAKTTFVVSLVNALVLMFVFYLLASSFVSILSVFMVIVGTLLTPLIAVAANLPPEKVPGAVAAIAKDGGIQVIILTAKLGVLFFVGNSCTIIASRCLLAGIAHGIIRLLGSTRSFRTTAASYAYASAAWTLSTIPIVNLLSPVYGAVLDVIAMRRLHESTYTRAISAVAIAAVIPVIALILVSCR